MNKDLKFKEYQGLANQTAIYRSAIVDYVTDLEIPDKDKEQFLIELLGKTYAILGLCGEAGEIANKFKKFLRGDKHQEDFIDEIGKEYGDVQWYVSAGVGEFGYDLGYVAQKNIDKLFKRKEDGKLKGSGDNR